MANNTVIQALRPRNLPTVAILTAGEHLSAREPALASAAKVLEGQASPHGVVYPDDLLRSDSEFFHRIKIEAAHRDVSASRVIKEALGARFSSADAAGNEGGQH